MLIALAATEYSYLWFASGVGHKQMDVAPVNFVMSVCLFIRLSAVSGRPPLSGFMWNLILKTYMKIYRENPDLVINERKIWAASQEGQVRFTGGGNIKSPYKRSLLLGLCQTVCLSVCLSICISVVSTGPINVKFVVGGLIWKSVETFRICLTWPPYRVLSVKTCLMLHCYGRH